MDELARVRRSRRRGRAGDRRPDLPNQRVCHVRATRRRPAMRAGRVHARGRRRAGAHADPNSRVRSAPACPQTPDRARPARARAISSSVRAARPSSATSITPWSPCTTLSDWRRGSARRNWSSARPSRARSEAGELRVRVAPRTHGEHGDPRAGEQQLLRRELLRRVLALGGVGARAAPRAAAARARAAGFSSSSRRYIAVPISAARALGRLAVGVASATGRRRSATGSRTARPGSGSARTRATRARCPAAGPCGRAAVALAMPWAKCRSRITRGVSRVRIAVRRTSSSLPRVGLYASRRRLASSTSTERSSSALSCSTRA